MRSSIEITAAAMKEAGKPEVKGFSLILCRDGVELSTHFAPDLLELLLDPQRELMDDDIWPQGGGLIFLKMIQMVEDHVKTSFRRTTLEMLPMKIECGVDDS